MYSDGYIEFRDGVPFKRYYEDEEGAEHDPFYCFMDGDLSSTSEAGKNHLNEILGSNHSFDTVKPVQLLRTLIQSCTSPTEGHIVLDFFAGSGTTAEALIGLNAEDAGRRRFLLVQIAEPNGLKGSKSDYDIVSDITKERIRRAGKRILAGNFSPEWNKDIGFRSLKIDTPNMVDVQNTPDATNQADLLANVDSIKQGRTSEDLLFQVLVDWGVDLALPIRSETVQGKRVFFVDENALVACFDTGVTEELVTELAAHEPLRVVFRDTGFASDAVKINVQQIFKQLSPMTDVKAI